MKKRFGIWLLALAVFLPACQKKDNPEGAGKDLTVIFATATGMVGDGYNELVISTVKPTQHPHRTPTPLPCSPSTFRCRSRYVYISAFPGARRRTGHDLPGGQGGLHRVGHVRHGGAAHRLFPVI